MLRRNYKKVVLLLYRFPARSHLDLIFLSFVSLQRSGNSIAARPAFGRRRETYEPYRSILPGLCPVAVSFVASRQWNREFGHVSEENAERADRACRQRDELRCLPCVLTRIIERGNSALCFTTAAHRRNREHPHENR